MCMLGNRVDFEPLSPSICLMPAPHVHMKQPPAPLHVQVPASGNPARPRSASDYQPLEVVQPDPFQRCLLSLVFYTCAAAACGLSFVACSSSVCEAFNVMVASAKSLFPIIDAACDALTLPCQQMTMWGWGLLNIAILAFGASAAQHMFVADKNDFQTSQDFTMRFCHLSFSILIAILFFDCCFDTISAKEKSSGVLLFASSFFATELILFHSSMSGCRLLRSLGFLAAVVSAIVSIQAPEFIPQELSIFFRGEYSAHVLVAFHALMAVEGINLLGYFAHFNGLFHEENAIYVLTRVVGAVVCVYYPLKFFEHSVFPALVVCSWMVPSHRLLLAFI
jgi:hypothetical protein